MLRAWPPAKTLETSGVVLVFVVETLLRCEEALLTWSL